MIREKPMDLWTTRRFTYGHLVDSPVVLHGMICKGEGGAAHESAHRLRSKRRVPHKSTGHTDNCKDNKISA